MRCSLVWSLFQIKTSVSFDRGQRMTHRLVSAEYSGKMADNDLFGGHIFNEREPVSCHDKNPVFDDLVDLPRRTRKCTRNRPFHSL